VHLLAKSANFASQFRKLACHFVEILAAGYADYRRGSFRDFILPTAKF
jgi:hypothetical protein